MMKKDENDLPDIISLGELLVEIMRTDKDVPHGIIGATYKGPYPSGAPAIFIDSAARLGDFYGLKTGFIGVVGNDEFGESILKKLTRDKVDVSQIRISRNKTTGIAFNQYNSDGTRKFIFAAGAAGDTSPKDVKKEYFSNVKALHVMGSALSISKSSRDACYKAIKITKKMNPEAIISFDPNLRSEMLDINIILKICRPVLKKTDILLPSGEEANMLTGLKNFEQSCIKLLEEGPSMVVLKKGSKGATLYTQKNKKGLTVPAFKVNEIDPTGAGDTFGGAFLIGILNDWKHEKALKFACAAGALKVKHFGPMPETSLNEVLSMLG
ncbi:MAG: carbohydrate kinase family protein [Promethearchaeota archaeon]